MKRKKETSSQLTANGRMTLRRETTHQGRFGAGLTYMLLSFRCGS